MFLQIEFQNLMKTMKHFMHIIKMTVNYLKVDVKGKDRVKLESLDKVCITSQTMN